MSKTYLVTGATGNMGRSVVSTLLSLGHKVHAYTRNKSSAAAQKLASTGATLFEGDFSSTSALESASKGCDGFFLMMVPGPDVIKFASNALEAFQSSGPSDAVVVMVTSIMKGESSTQLVHSPNAGLPNKGPHEFIPAYWGMNDAAEKVLKDSRIPHWTILRPAWFMSNYTDFAVRYIHWPALNTRKKLIASVRPDTLWELNDPHDIGTWAAYALVEKGEARWEHKEISIASENLTLEEQAAVISRVSGIEVKAEFRDEATAAKLAEDDFMGYLHFWQLKLAPKVDMEEMRSFGLELGSFEKYLTRNRETLMKALNDTKDASGGQSTDEIIAAAGQHGQ